MPRLNSFRLQYASNLFVDLHNKKYDTLVKPVCSTLALLGNIGHPHNAKTYHFLNYCSRNWDKTLWITGSHELTKTTDVSAVKALTYEFSNVQCLDAEEEVFLSENTIVLGLPPESPSVLQKFYRSTLTHTVLRTVFWSMTHPMANLVFLTSTAPQTPTMLIPIRGSVLEAPTSLWMVGNSTKNTLSIDSTGNQLFATNSCFVDSRLGKVASYSPTASVEIVNPRARSQVQLETQNPQLAFSA